MGRATSPTEAGEDVGRPTVALVGTLDTKGEEYAFALDVLHGLGLNTIMIDTGALGPPSFRPEVSAAEVARAAGSDLDQLRRADRAQALVAMGRGARLVLESLFSAGRLRGALALGGSGNTEIAGTAFRGLPIGFPKLILTTMMGGDLRGLLGETDIVLAQSLTDIAGLNRISRVMISNASAALAGMVASPPPPAQVEGRPTIVASMVGLTSVAVTAARRRLEELGYEVVVFHMTGLGGNAMESLIDAGGIAGVLDLTTSELADELGGGICASGPQRLTTASRRRVPQVVAPGGLDMVNFGAAGTVPARYKDRPQHVHTAQVTLVRTDAAMCADLGRLMVDRLSGDPKDDEGPRDYRPVLLLPSGGFSAIDRPGQPFYDPVADEALRAAVRARADPGRVRVLEVDGELDSRDLGVLGADLLHQLVSQPDNVSRVPDPAHNMVTRL